MQRRRSRLRRLVGFGDAREIGRSRPRVELLQQRIMSRIAPQARHGGIRVCEIAEPDRLRRARGLTGGDDFAVFDEAGLPLREAPRAADALDAIGAFLHHAARAHADVRIVGGLHQRLAEIAEFLAVRVAEEVEAAHLVGTVGLAEPGADAAIVDLHVEAFVVVHGSFDRTDRLAGRRLALHAGHGLEDGLRIRSRRMIVGIDPEPMHDATHADFIRPDRRDVVFRLAGDDAGVAADAGARIDHHRPCIRVAGERRRRRVEARLRRGRRNGFSRP